MASIILVANEASKDKLEAIGALINDSAKADLILIADANLEGTLEGATLIPEQKNNFSDSLAQALRVARTTNIILLSAELEIGAAEINEMIAAANANSADTVLIANTIYDGETAELSEGDAEQIMNILSYEKEFPASFMIADKEIFKRLADADFRASADLIALAAVKAAGNEVSLGKLATTLTASDSSSDARLSNTAKSLILNTLIEKYTIEEIFVNHSWSEHSEESAAASYHTLAALFIKFGDYASATECLKLSDKFEESPRSLALKGLIALNRGETLGAVANMVSSLQQYEVRKNSDAHYLTFNPTDLEKINSDLVSGLDALNKRDNEKAFDFFTQAVYNFDSFYSECGLKFEK